MTRPAERPYFLEGIEYLEILDGDGHYLQLPKLTTAQRDALSATEGMMIYNTDTGRVAVYQDGGWVEIQPWVITGTTLNFFMSDDAADIGSYYYMYPTESGDGYSELTSPSLSTGDDQLLWSFVTEAGEPGVEVLALGAYTTTLFLKKTGNKDVRVYWKLFKRNTGGTETEILQSAVSDYLTADNSQYLISAYLNEDQTLDPTDRLVLKLFANVSGTGTDVTVTLTMEGDYDSRLTINVLSSAFNLDRLSDVTITSPADNEVLAYDSGSGKWINQTVPAHGNEAHNPDFLALDGSNKMTGDLFGASEQPLPWLARFVGIEIARNSLDTFRTLHTNILAYNTLRGGSVAFSETPDEGGASNLFDGQGSYVRWTSYSLPLSIEVTFWQKITYNTTWVILFRDIPTSVDFTLEYYDPVDATWKTIVSKSGWTKMVFAYEYNVAYNGATKLRLTITGTGSAGNVGLCQIAALNWAAVIESYSLPLSGGDIYGDIDMNGHDILNVGEITYASSGLKIGEHVLPILDQDGVPVARFEPDGTIAAESFVIFSPQVPDDPHEALQVALQEARKPSLPYKGLCPRESATELQEKIKRLEGTLEKLDTELKNSQALAESERARPTEEIQKEIARVSGKLAELKRRQKIAQEAGTPLDEKKTYGKDLGKIVFGLLRYVEALEDRLRTLEKGLQRRS